MAKLSLDDRLNQIEDKISEKSFRENKGLGNEVGYYIFDYDPREELYVRNHIAYLKDRINNGNKDFRIVEFDLFHLMVEILQEEGYLVDICLIYAMISFLAVIVLTKVYMGVYIQKKEEEEKKNGSH